MHVFIVSNPISNLLAHTIRQDLQLSVSDCLFLSTRSLKGKSNCRYIDIPCATNWDKSTLRQFIDFLWSIYYSSGEKGIHAYIPHLYHDGHAVLASHPCVTTISYIEEGGVAHTNTVGKGIRLQLYTSDSVKLWGYDKDLFAYLYGNKLFNDRQLIAACIRKKPFPFFLQFSSYASSFIVSEHAFVDHGDSRVLLHPQKYIDLDLFDISGKSIFYMPSSKFSQWLNDRQIDWIKNLVQLCTDRNIRASDLVLKFHGDTPIDDINEVKKAIPKCIDYELFANCSSGKLFLDEATVLPWENAIFCYRTSAIQYTRIFNKSTNILFSNPLM